MHISPTTGTPASPQCSSKAGSAATGQPPFCGSSPTLTWTKQSGRRPVVAIALASAATSDGRSTEWMASKKRSEEHTSELQSRRDLVCRLLLEKKKKKTAK